MLEHMYPKIDVNKREHWYAKGKKLERSECTLYSVYIAHTIKVEKRRTKIENWKNDTKQKQQQGISRVEFFVWFVAGVCIYVHLVAFFSLFFAWQLNFYSTFLVTLLCAQAFWHLKAVYSLFPLSILLYVLLKSLQNSTHSKNAWAFTVAIEASKLMKRHSLHAQSYK